MSRTIASSAGKLLTEPDGGLLSGTLKFVLESNTLNSPAQTYGEIVVTDGEYSGTVAVGVYTINFIQYANTYRLGTSIAVNDGATIDVLTLVGLDDVPTSAADLILTEMQTLADQTALDAVQTGEDRVATGEDVTAAQAARDKAEEWAEEAEDVEVEVGQYSAKHWAAKAEAQADIVLTALGDIDAALDSINGEVI